VSTENGSSLSNPVPLEAKDLRIAGWVPFTTVDFPGRLAAVIFLQGCPWRCGYCHNPHLWARRGEEEVPWLTIRTALEKRKGFLQGVVFSGGEPTFQPALAAGLREVRAMGLATGLHTAGIFPKRLAAVLPLLDWVGLDAKAPPDARYDEVTGRKHSAARFLQSLALVLASGVDYELRTTVDASRLGGQDCLDLEAALEKQNAQPTKWQILRQPVRQPE
jgi:pyruvate formate lyase activating enzyme